jgi:hypothetical protein
LLRADSVVELSGEGVYSELSTGIFSHSIFANTAGETQAKILFTKRYNHALQGIETAIRAKADYASSAQEDSLYGVGKGIASSIKNADKGDLRSEFA